MSEVGTTSGQEQVRQPCLSDAIPLKDLERIARLEEHADELERKAAQMHLHAARFRDLAKGIRDFYAAVIKRDGLSECIERAREADGVEWDQGVVQG